MSLEASPMSSVLAASPTSSPSALEHRLQRPNQTFRPELDFLRSMAVTMVVIDHTALALHHETLWRFDGAWLGLFGVLFFFVHTTLVLMWSLERKPYTLDFYIRRAFRIYPLAVLAIIIATALHAPLTGTNGHFFQFHPISTGNFFAASLLLYNLAPGHWAYTPIVNVVWTLPLEADMYVLLPCLFAFVNRFRSRWPILVFWLLACGVAGTSGQSKGLTFISAIPCFIPGLLAWIGYRTVRRRIPAYLFLPFLLLLTLGMLLKPGVPTGWILCLLLGFCLPYFHPFRSSLLRRSSHLVARYSYGIYLSHPFGLWIGMYLLRGHSLPVQFTAELAIISVASVAGYHLLESPMIRYGARLAARVEVFLQSGPRRQLSLDPSLE